MADTTSTDDWCKALRSGEYKQSHEGFLHHDGSYCCLGVAAERNGFDIYWMVKNSQSSLHDLDWEKMEASRYIHQELLADLNDTGATFGDIANLLEWAKKQTRFVSNSIQDVFEYTDLPEGFKWEYIANRFYIVSTRSK